MSRPNAISADESFSKCIFPPFKARRESDVSTSTNPRDPSAAQSAQRPVLVRSTTEGDDLLLPASWRNMKEDIESPKADYREFLTKDLCVPRLNAIHNMMWVVGRPMPPRPLTAQLMHQRDIVVTEDMNLHLVWTKGRILLKPLPRYLLDPSFWRRRLTPGAGKQLVKAWPATRDECAAPVEELAPCAAGFFFTWTSLIAYESDWKIAHDKGLIPENLTWWQWKALAAQFLDHSPTTIYAAVNQRFHYGELRLSRLNKIYRLRRLDLRGYLFGYSMKSDFFEDNFTRLASVLGYVVIVLTAMQVGLGTTRLQESQRFQNASYGFTVFSIIAPLLAIVLVLVVFLFLVLWNVWETKKYEKKRFKTMGIKQGEPEA